MNIRVCARFRRANRQEIIEEKTMSQKTIDNLRIEVEVFEKVGPQIVVDLLDGFNCTVLAYGQTGAGKTFTIQGTDKLVNGRHENMGLIPRCLDRLYDLLETDKQIRKWSVEVSYVEIYQKKLRDLLDLRVSENLRIRDPVHGETFIANLTEVQCLSRDQVLLLHQLGSANRTTSATRMNASSSRSHSIFYVKVSQQRKDGTVLLAQLKFVDLAGSESRRKGRLRVGFGMRETTAINKSLYVLSQTINAISSRKDKVPYRDSELTHILRSSLDGNCKTTLVTCCSPHAVNRDETISSLQFAQRAKTIRAQKAWRNEKIKDEQTRTEVQKWDVSHRMHTSKVAVVDISPRCSIDDIGGEDFHKTLGFSKHVISSRQSFNLEALRKLQSQGAELQESEIKERPILRVYTELQSETDYKGGESLDITGGEKVKDVVKNNGKSWMTMHQLLVRNKDLEEELIQNRAKVASLQNEHNLMEDDNEQLRKYNDNLAQQINALIVTNQNKEKKRSVTGNIKDMYDDLENIMQNLLKQLQDVTRTKDALEEEVERLKDHVTATEVEVKSWGKQQDFLQRRGLTSRMLNCSDDPDIQSIQEIVKEQIEHFNRGKTPLFRKETGLSVSRFASTDNVKSRVGSFWESEEDDQDSVLNPLEFMKEGVGLNIEGSLSHSHSVHSLFQLTADPIYSCKRSEQGEYILDRTMLNVNCKVDVLDLKTYNWHSATIIDIDEERGRVKFRYDSFDERYDDWVSKESLRLQLHNSRARACDVDGTSVFKATTYGKTNVLFQSLSNLDPEFRKETSEVVMQGWMTKMGKYNKNWNRRFFQLNSQHFITYYRTRSLENLLGQVNLDKAQEIEKYFSKERQHPYSLTMECDTRVWYFECDSMSLMVDWWSVIKATKEGNLESIGISLYDSAEGISEGISDVRNRAKAATSMHYERALKAVKEKALETKGAGVIDILDQL